MPKGVPTSIHDLPKNITDHLRIGTCSWNYPEWQEIGIYSAKQAKHYDYLPEYSKHFNTAEVDQWFWSLESRDTVRLPRKTDVEMYADQTPDNFKFTVKAPNAITLTHFYKQAGPTLAGKPNPHFLSLDLLKSFLNLIRHLKDKIGVIMFEFEYLNKEKMPSLNSFIDTLGPFLNELPDEYNFAIESRNPNYLKEEYFTFLKEHKVGHVFVEGYYMPPVAGIYEKFGDLALTCDNVVIRLLGADRQGIEKKTNKKWTEIVEPRDEALKEIAEFVSKLIPLKFDVYANFNNHLEGSAPLTIKKFLEILDTLL